MNRVNVLKWVDRFKDGWTSVSKWYWPFLGITTSNLMRVFQISIAITILRLISQYNKVLPHPAYSAGLAMFDFYLHETPKEVLRGERVANNQKIKKAAPKVASTPTERILCQENWPS